MRPSTGSSRRTAESKRTLKKAIFRVEALIGKAVAPPWLVVPDANVIVRGVASDDPRSPSRWLLAGAVGGIFVCVVSDEARREVYDVLQRPFFGWSESQIDEALGEFWAMSRFVPLAPVDPAYLRFVKDPKDVYIIQTAASTYSIEDLASLRTRLIVSVDAKALPRGRWWGNFRCCSANEFWHELQDALPRDD